MTTEPLGAVKIPIAGNGGTTLLSPAGFGQPAALSGTANFSAESVLEDMHASWIPGEWAGSHYVLFEDGRWNRINDNSTDAIHLEGNGPGGLGVSFEVVPCPTLDALFGEDNTAGFRSENELAGSDLLIAWDAISQSTSGPYYYSDEAGRWQDATGQYAGDYPFSPDITFLVIGVVAHSVTLTGSVPMTARAIHIAGEGGTTLFPNPYPVESALHELLLEDVLSGGPTSASGDLVAVFDVFSQRVANIYYYDLRDASWRDLDGDVLDTSVKLPVGSACVVIRQAEGNVTWTDPYASRAAR